VQTCLVHQVRSSLRFVSYKDRKTLAADLRKIYTAVDADHAADELTAFAEKWDDVPDDQRQLAGALGADHPVPGLPPGRPALIYTTNSIKHCTARPGRSIKTRGHFPTEDAAAN